MDCREFLDKHVLYVDQACSAEEEDRLREHVRGCPSCARHDALVRRSLMLVRSLPTIEPSPDFRARLEARLREAKPPALTPAGARIRASQAVFAGLAAAIAFLAYFGAGFLTRSEPAVVRMPPVVATVPESDERNAATPAFVAVVPTGMSVWPAIMVSQAQVQFVAAELASER